ncbi:Cell division cycle 20 [Schistosoma japonicum]|uniref:Cell division cycle 20 n=1 Tax=Schistosoma japonicum TaxID=6182 RepID=A0A4Z2D6P5_SCHJA|nr:Cell division cycle 20 [Schistosoma japonicum]
MIPLKSSASIKVACLCVAPSPNDEMVASCASDETLRIWHCFQVDHNKKRIQEKGQRPSSQSGN